MKTLLLVRHGEAGWVSGLSDSDRPLSAKGLADAPIMANELKAHNIIPELLFVSGAKRTKQTADAFCETLAIAQENNITCPELYLCRTETILETIACAPNDANTIAIIAHNPTLSYLGSMFSKESHFDMPPLGIFIGTFDVDNWLDVNPQTMTEYAFISPQY